MITKLLTIINKVTQVFRIERHRVPKAVAQRKKWAKFGDVSGEAEGPNRANTQIADEVFLTLTSNREVSEDRKREETGWGAFHAMVCVSRSWSSVTMILLRS